ncbi:C-C motif chemokine ligand 24 [Rhinolophus ferrumequinum]|uniref:C-C motif chemokine ligand 24 n=1 Tax=Rhinolophus ferrumequinum TaxID=59479 RepID=A0A671EHD5_RHIFE|nr:C-C motif chemokine 24 [Rhinolophus ferrumequinum]KAF6356682.1 C-C motif chemokine ligand 24 [Rhinolophus ferrumequinum]
MAGPTTMAASLLLLVLCTHCIAPAGSVTIPSSCCMSFISKKIPESRVVSYQLSSGSICPKAGVIFTTKKGQKFCGNPKKQWVQRYMKNLNSKQKKASSWGQGNGHPSLSPETPY